MGLKRLAHVVLLGPAIPFLIGWYLYRQLKSRSRYTADQLHYAAAYGDAILLTKILRSGHVTVNQRNSEGTTALMLSVANNHEDCAKLLLQHGADTTIRRITGTHALYFACQTGLTDLVDLLLQYHAPVDQVTYEGATALFIAVEDNHVEIVNLLVKHGADINARASSGYTPLMLAVKFNHVHIAKVLLKKGANPNCKIDGDGCTPLLLAVIMNYIDMAKVLARCGADINDTGNESDSPLFRAIRHGSFEMVMELLSFKPSQRSELGNGHTCLHAAVLRGDLGILQALLDAGHSTNVTDSRGLSAVQYAKILQRKDIEDLLKDPDKSHLLPLTHPANAIMLL